MNTRAIVVALGIVIVLVVGLGLGANHLPFRNNSTSGAPQSGTSSSPPVVTLEDIIAGKFPTAADKQGTGGVYVTVDSLLVLYVHTESDGDWHVAVTDGHVSVFITEITPGYQSALGMPPTGSTIDETGIPYCDTNHQTEAWHGDTCWEIHPVISWQAMQGTTTAATNTKPAVGLSASISYGSNPIAAGSTQNISVAITDSDGPMSGANVNVEVLYASGQTTHDFTCTTDSNGSCSVSWTIGSTSAPGTFQVTVTVEGSTFYSTFEVT